MTSDPSNVSPDLAQVSWRSRDGVPIVEITGEIDMSNAARLKEVLTQLPNQALGLVVDLRQTTFIDSSGISLLHDLATRMTDRSQRLVIVCDSQSLPLRVLKLAGVDTRIPVLGDGAQAVAHVLDGDGDAPSG